MTNNNVIPLPTEFTNKFPDLSLAKALKYHDKYLNAIREYLFRALPHIQGDTLNFPLRKAWDMCGDFQYNNNRYYIWKEFFAIQPFFYVIKEGSKWSGMISEIKITDQKFIDLLIDTADVDMLIKTFYSKYDISERVCVPIDIESLTAYISRTITLLETLPESDPRLGKVTQNLRTAKFFKLISEHYYTHYGEYVIPHIKSNKVDYGRTYYKGINLQNCSKEVRIAALGYHVSYDLNAAAYAIKLILTKNIFDELGYKFIGAFTYTKEYLDHKSEIRHELAQVIHEHMPNYPNPLKLVKEAMTAIGFGAKLHEGSWEYEGIKRYSALHYIIYNKKARQAFAKHNFVVNFLKEQDLMSKIIYEYNSRNENFIQKVSHVTDLFNNNGTLNKNKIIAYLYQQFETKIMDIATENIIPHFRIHDSFIMRKPLSNETYTEIQYMLNSISPYLKLEKEEHHGWVHQHVYDMELEHKQFIAEEEELAKFTKPDKVHNKYTKSYSHDMQQSDSMSYDGYDDGSQYDEYSPERDDMVSNMTVEERREHYRIIGYNPNQLPSHIQKLLKNGS